jgi:hypothetical protein
MPGPSTKPLVMVLPMLVSIASCGGDVIGSSQDSGSQGDSTTPPGDGTATNDAVTPTDSGNDALRSDSSGPTDAGLPAPDSSQCNLPGNFMGRHPCILCSDDKWHCGGGGTVAFPSCPPGIKNGATCHGGETCFSCDSDNSGAQFSCLNDVWAEDPVVPCSR